MSYPLKSGIVVFIVSVLLFCLHYLAVYIYYDGDQFTTRPPLLSIHLFLLISTLLIVTGMRVLYKLVPDQIGVIFLVSVMFKIGAALVIFPQLLNGEPPLSTLELLNFLIAYFCYLAIEGFLVARWLNRT